MSQRIALCLSGGGFRAALFHLGVVRALRDVGWLPHIKYISSVSGGSILAAHLVLNWKQYCGSPESFDEAAAELLRFTQKDIRGRIVRRYLPLIVLRGLVTIGGKIVGAVLSRSANDWLERFKDRLTATGLLECYYSSLYQGARLSSLPVQEDCYPAPGETQAPELHILGTNITKAAISSFSGHGFLSSPYSAHVHGRDIIKVSEAVAASSAFPGFFPPLRLSRRTIPWDLSELATEDQYIADAGVVDNLGLSLSMQLRRQTELDLVIVSDATGSVDWAVAKRMRHVIGSTLRTLEILTGQSTQLTKERVYQDFTALKKDRTPIYVFIEISRLLDKGRVSNQASIKNIRTDLDRFSATEIVSLAQHGHAVARDALSKLGLGTEPAEVSENWPLTILGHRRQPAEREHRELTNAGDVRLGFGGFVRDWLGWAYALLLVGGPLLGYFLVADYVERSVATQTRAERNYKVSRFKAQPARVVEPFEYETLRSFDNPQYQSFEFLDDTRYFDLRRWKPPIEGATAPSLVTMVREMRVRKVADADYIRIQFRTSGTDVYVSAPRGTHRYAGPVRKTTGGRLLQSREIVLEVRDIAVGDEETLVVEATYHNAFNTRDQWWAGALIHGQIPRAGLVLIFPSDRPYQTLECRRSGEEHSTIVPCVGLLQAGDRTFAYWEIDKPESGYVYELGWTWPDELTGRFENGWGPGMEARSPHRPHQMSQSHQHLRRPLLRPRLR